MKVFWQLESMRWQTGIVEVRRGDMCVVRRWDGFEEVLAMGMLFVEGPT